MTTIPNPTGPKGIPVYDTDGGELYIIPVTVNSSDQIDTGGALAVGGLATTTSGVTDTTNKRFVTDQELADISTLHPLAALTTELTAIGAQTGAETLLASVANVNLNSGTATTLYTVPTGKTAVITRLVIRNASTSLTTVSFSVGFNSTAFNNILADATHTELTGNTLYSILIAKAGAAIGAAAAVLKLLCNTLQGGAATCSVDIFGYLF